MNQADGSILAADADVLAILGKFCFPDSTMSTEINTLDFFIDTILPYLHYTVKTRTGEVLGVRRAESDGCDPVGVVHKSQKSLLGLNIN